MFEFEIGTYEWAALDSMSFTMHISQNKQNNERGVRIVLVMMCNELIWNAIIYCVHIEEEENLVHSVIHRQSHLLKRWMSLSK